LDRCSCTIAASSRFASTFTSALSEWKARSTADELCELLQGHAVLVAMAPGRSTYAPEIREATNGGERVMSSRLLSALQRHPKLSRPCRRAANAPQLPAIVAQGDGAAPDFVEPAPRTAARRKPRHTALRPA
jgi:hypothetical protein